MFQLSRNKCWRLDKIFNRRKYYHFRGRGNKYLHAVIRTRCVGSAKSHRLHIRQLVEMRVLNGRAADNLDVDENMMRILLIVRNMFSRAGLLDTIAANAPK